MTEEGDIRLGGELPGNALSFSKIRCFLTCGYQFFLRYVKKDHAPPTAGMVLGRAFHKGQEYGVKQMIERATPAPGMVTEFAVAHFEEQVKEEVDIEFDEKDPNEAVVKDDLARMSGPVFDKSVSKLDPITSEESIEFEVGGVLVRGRLDIKDRKGDGVAITELKSGTRNPEILMSFDWQTSIYQYSKKISKETVLGLRKIFAKRHQDKARNFSLSVYEKKPDPDTLIADIVTSIGRVAEAIKSASVHGFVKTSDLRICAWCGHRKNCRPEIFGYEGMVEKYVDVHAIYTTKEELKNGKRTSKTASPVIA